ncbi:MAG: replication initiation factor domain-containing protein [Zoogloeaceae bacterium]|nr:replication initiation factor domain-containing protein [Zoogloeaceae bacterium]
METPYLPPRSTQPECSSADADAALRAERQPRTEGAGGSAEGTPRTIIWGESADSPTPQPCGESYRLVVGSDGRSHAIATPLPKPDGIPSAALTDYLNLTFPFPQGRAGIPAFLAELHGHLGLYLGGLTDRRRGLHGWLESFAFDRGGALFAVGGQRGTALLSLPGDACKLIPDWLIATEWFRNALKAKITRWDGAVDDFEGTHPVDWAADQYTHHKGFNAGGNRPKCNQAGNWIEPDGSGRTFYVGKRKNGKLMRIYEKGKQLGDENSPWVRWELELHGTDRVIPFEVLLEPGKYVAGAYPCTGWIQEEQCRVRTIQKTAEVSYEHLTHCARQGYGQHFAVMLAVEGSADKVMAKVMRDGIPKRLRLPIPPEAREDGRAHPDTP